MFNILWQNAVQRVDCFAIKWARLLCSILVQIQGD